MHEPALIKEILDNPELDEPWLVYADWLEERGDTQRAEFLRIQNEFNKFSFNHPAVAELRSELSGRFKSLPDEHKVWLNIVATKYHVWYLAGNLDNIEFIRLLRVMAGIRVDEQQAQKGIAHRILTSLKFPRAEQICEMISKVDFLFAGESKLITILPSWRESPELKSTSTNKNDSTVP